MLALVFNGPGKARVVEKPVPEPGPGEVLVRISCCGICGSDIHAFQDGFLPPEVTVGHEYSGVVAAAGPGVALQTGQAVTGNNILPCGECLPCRLGRDNICSAMRRLGITADGAMAEYLLVPASSLSLLPPGGSLEQAALAEPYSVALHGAWQAGLPGRGGAQGIPGAIILGGGAIGLCLLVELKRQGVSPVFVLEPDSRRRDLALQLGADGAEDPGPGCRAAAAAVGRWTGGAGAGLVFECAGVPATIAEAGSLAARGGTVVVLGVCKTPVPMDFLSLVTGEIRVITAFGKTAAEFREAASLVGSGAVNLSPLISMTVPLAGAAQLFSRLAQDPARAPACKVLVCIG